MFYSLQQTHKSTVRPSSRAADNARNQPYCALKIHQILQTGLVSNFLSWLCVLIVLVVAQLLSKCTFYKQKLYIFLLHLAAMNNEIHLCVFVTTLNSLNLSPPVFFARFSPKLLNSSLRLSSTKNLFQISEAIMHQNVG